MNNHVSSSVCLCVHMYICMLVLVLRACVCVCEHMGVCMCIYACGHMSEYACEHMGICVYMGVFVCGHISE